MTYWIKEAVNTKFFDKLIDNFSIWQHTSGTSILREEGYALDDATRGLLFTVVSGREQQSEVLLSYIVKSQSGNSFYGFCGPDRKFLPGVASDDAVGQVIWAAGLAYNMNFHKSQAEKLIDKAMSYIDNTSHVRGYAYALLGAVYIDENVSKKYYLKLKNFFNSTDRDWFWPEPTLTYGNAIMPYAFLRFGLIYKNAEAINIGRKLLMFLEEKCTHKRRRGPIGNDGWMPRDKEIAPTYSQQPIDTAYMVWAWLVAYQISGKSADKQKALDWMGWFEGDNVADTKMYDPKDMHAFDGIDSYGVHMHSGAESNICLLLSKHMMKNNVTV